MIYQPHHFGQHQPKSPPPPHKNTKYYFGAGAGGRLPPPRVATTGDKSAAAAGKEKKHRNEHKKIIRGRGGTKSAEGRKLIKPPRLPLAPFLPFAFYFFPLQTHPALDEKKRHHFHHHKHILRQFNFRSDNQQPDRFAQQPFEPLPPAAFFVFYQSIPISTCAPLSTRRADFLSVRAAKREERE